MLARVNVLGLLAPEAVIAPPNTADGLEVVVHAEVVRDGAP